MTSVISIVVVVLPVMMMVAVCDYSQFVTSFHQLCHFHKTVPIGVKHPIQQVSLVHSDVIHSFNHKPLELLLGDICKIPRVLSNC